MSISSANMIIIIRYCEIKSINKALPFYQVDCSRANMFYSIMPEFYRSFINRKCSVIGIFSICDEVQETTNILENSTE